VKDGSDQQRGKPVSNRFDHRDQGHLAVQRLSYGISDPNHTGRLCGRIRNFDGQNLTNVLDVIDFGGLFSGNAIGPSRSFALRLTTNF
jgi:hypothetical protein